MQWNGIDPDLIHRAVRRAAEQAVGREQDIHTIETTRGTLVAYATAAKGEYAAQLNIAAKSQMEAEEAMEAIRAWAIADGGVHELMPTGSPGRVYDAICTRVNRPQMRLGRFGTCEVRWTLPNPSKRSAVQSRATISNSKTLSLWIAGTAETDIEIEVKPKAAASTLTLSLDGSVFFVRNAKTSAGQTLKIVMGQGVVTLDGADAAGQTDWQQTDYDRPLNGGMHILSCSVSADITVRWYDRWA